MPDANEERVENLGPAEVILASLIAYTDHLYHGRPGVLTNDGRTKTGVKWAPATWKEEEGVRVAYRLDKVGNKSNKVRLGVLNPETNQIVENNTVVGRYQNPGLFPEVVTYLYDQIATVYGMDQEFAAKWASWSFAKDHRDLKVLLAAFMLVQGRSGNPIREGKEVLFHDEDYREVGEAMCLIRRRDGKDLNPKLLLRVGNVLNMPEVAAINRRLGFGRSAKNAFLGRWPNAVKKWLRQRERNPKMLEGLVKAGFRTTVIELARRVGYKPDTDAFFVALRWKQKQSADGRRNMALGIEFDAAESWEGMSEAEICQRIISDKPNWKRIVGLIPRDVGLTRAVTAAAIEGNCLSNADLIILTPTLEELGLLQVPDIKMLWDGARQAADNQRAANIAKRVKSQDTKQELQDASDNAMKKAVEEQLKDLRVYWVVDKSGSMSNCIEQAKGYITKMLAGFPLDKVHVSVFNTTGREVPIKHASFQGVTAAFAGHAAGGGTNYGAGVSALRNKAPKPEEDSLMIFVGDQEQRPTFERDVANSGLRPAAFGMVHVGSRACYTGRANDAVERTATRLGIPFFEIDNSIFEDPYAVTRTLQHLIASTPVGQAAVGQPVRRRKGLVEEVLETELLTRPRWA